MLLEEGAIAAEVLGAPDTLRTDEDRVRHDRVGDHRRVKALGLRRAGDEHVADPQPRRRVVAVVVDVHLPAGVGVGGLRSAEAGVAAVTGVSGRNRVAAPEGQRAVVLGARRRGVGQVG
jgi:hypothetical protein